MSLRNQSARRFLISATAALAVLYGGLYPAWANPPHDGKKHNPKHQLEALEEQWRVAQLAGDMTTMERMLSDDYLGISMTGEVDTKAQQLHRVADRRLTLTKIELSDMKVKLVGAAAIVTSRAQVEGTNDGRPVAGMFRYTRVYRRLASGQWKITSFEATPENASEGQSDGAPTEKSARRSSGAE
jgi:ketosteroid isomerase-like protein